eukprot:TRINITY_DN25623_c1_g1_i1.p1 TRINITY_DN25623_c1_g1~~TRINITY_DN25623_c1_g1_i1.p1  ORF type:complete len:385 (-),score=117.60 TRINITY_DN25623_c1_g1_i1:59-1213(-)
MPGMQQGGMPGMQQGGMPGMQQGGMPGMQQGGMPGMGGMMMPNPMMMMAMMQNMKQLKAAGNLPPPMAAMLEQMEKVMGKAAGGGGGCGGGSQEKPKAKLPDPADNTIDPDIQELCDYFNIEDRWVKRLNETMKKRQDTKQEDIEKLYETLERARSPTGLLTVKIGEMECGRFIGKIKPDKDVERIARKFKLDDPVASRLTELLHRRKVANEAERGHKDLETIEQHLKYCKRPSAMATLLAGKLLEGEVDELPTLNEAEKLMEKYKLDEDARSKLREIVEKRADEKMAVLAQVERHLETSTFPSSMLCKIARPLIDNEELAEPPDRAVKGGNKGGGKGRGRSRDRDRRDRSRSRRRDRDRSGDRDRRRDRSRSRSRDRDRRRDD